MSAFVVDDETMDKCVRAILRSRQYQSALFPEFAGVATDAFRAGTLIGRMLFTMNVEAVEERYGRDEPPSTMTYKYRDVAVPYDYATRIADYKALQCLSYQCCEGAVPESALYQELEQVIGKIARSIIESTPEYERAPWG